jgi:hypothetical protein
MMVPLKGRYRSLIRWYPQAWRASRGNALIGVLLDVAESENRTRPTLSETFSIAASGMEERLDQLAPRIVRNPAATLTLAMGVGFAAVTLVLSSLAPSEVPGSPAGPLSRFGPFFDSGSAITLFWLVALGAAFGRKWAIGRIALIVSIAVVIAMPVVTGAATPPMGRLDPATSAFFIAAAIITVFGTPKLGRFFGGVTVVSAIVTWFGLGRPGGAIQQMAEDLWDRNIGSIWIAAGAAVVVASVFAITRRWATAFTIVLALVPVSAVILFHPFPSPLGERGNMFAIISPEVLGLILLVLSRSGHFNPPTRPSQKPMTVDASGGESVLIERGGSLNLRSARENRWSINRLVASSVAAVSATLVAAALITSAAGSLNTPVPAVPAIVDAIQIPPPSFHVGDQVMAPSGGIASTQIDQNAEQRKLAALMKNQQIEYVVVDLSSGLITAIGPTIQGSSSTYTR